MNARAKIAATLIAAVAAIGVFIAQDSPRVDRVGGGIDIFVGSTPTPVATVSSCTTTISSGSVSSSLSSATAGSTICLQAGSYSFTSGAITKTSITTVQAASGVAASDVTIANANIQNSSKITFSGVTINGATIGTSGAPATNVSFNNITWTGCILIYQPTSAVLNLTLNGGSVDTVGGSGSGSPCGDDGRIRVYGANTGSQGSSKNLGLTIENIDFGSQAHCTDGIELTGGAQGFTIGPGNTFHGILQNDPVACSTHVDPIQFYGADGGTIKGNYFYDNTDGILSSNGNGTNMTVQDNVFGDNGDDYPYAVVDCGDSGMLYSHNDFLDDALYLCASDVGEAGNTSSTTVTNNYMPGGFLWNGETACTGTTSDYNMAPGSVSGLCGGAHNFVGTAAFTGGATPSTYAGYQLTSISPGHTAGSDGLDVGPRY